MGIYVAAYQQLSTTTQPYQHLASVMVIRNQPQSPICESAKRLNSVATLVPRSASELRVVMSKVRC